MSIPTTDPYGLSRFIEVQENCYSQAREELRSGSKQGHWMWFIFPQITGLGSSAMAQRYAIQSLHEAAAYLEQPILGPRLTECAGALLELQGLTAEQILGYPDVLKLQSSMTLFSAVSSPGSVFQRVLEKYYGGEKDPETTRFIS